MDNDPNLLALNYYKIAASAMQADNSAIAISQFDECLCLNPHAEIAMAAWFNLATTIIRKHRFPTRDGDSIADEEYKWHECVLKCFARVVEVYEASVNSRPGVKQSCEMYKRAKDNLCRMTAYGLMVTDSGGKTKQRDLNKIKRMADPVRALKLYPPKREV